MLTNRIIEFATGVVTKILDDYYDMDIKYNKYLVIFLQFTMVCSLFYWVSQGNDYIFALFAIVISCYFAGNIDTDFYEIGIILISSLIIVLVLSQGVINFIKSVDPFLIVVSCVIFISVVMEANKFKEEYSNKKIFLRFLSLLITVFLYYNREIIQYLTKNIFFHNIYKKLMNIEQVKYILEKLNIPVARSSYIVVIGYFMTNIITMIVKSNNSLL